MPTCVSLRCDYVLIECVGAVIERGEYNVLVNALVEVAHCAEITFKPAGHLGTFLVTHVLDVT